MAHTLAEQFAQALANNELKVSDVGYVLEHIQAFLLDNHADVALWMAVSFNEVAEQLYKARDIADGVAQDRADGLA